MERVAQPPDAAARVIASATANTPLADASSALMPLR
jgi:hypothetical protein